ncbi:hypothetical protein EWM64_g9351, partial [Hericium alpestre]
MVKRKAPSTSTTHAADPKATAKRAKMSAASSQSNSAVATANSSARRAHQPSVTTEEEDDERIANESDEVVEIDLDGNETTYHANTERSSQVDEDEEPEDDETELAADDCKKASKAREQVVKGFLKTRSIVQAFRRTGKGTVSYSHRQHTKVETRLMKMGRPGYYIPSPSTISRDVKLVFANSHNQILKLLR